ARTARFWSRTAIARSVPPSLFRRLPYQPRRTGRKPQRTSGATLAAKCRPGGVSLASRHISQLAASATSSPSTVAMFDRAGISVCRLRIDEELDAPVPLASFRGRVGGDRIVG